MVSGGCQLEHRIYPEENTCVGKGRLRGIICYQAGLLAYFNINSCPSAAAIRVRWDCALRCVASCFTSLKPAIRINGCLQMFW